MIGNLKDVLEDWWDDMTRGRVTDRSIACSYDDVDVASGLRMRYVKEGMVCGYHTGVTEVVGSGDGDDTRYEIKPGVMAIVTTRPGGWIHGPSCSIGVIRFTRKEQAERSA